MWTYVLVLLGIHRGVKLLSHVVTLCLNFWGTAKLFSKIDASFYIPTKNVWGFKFFHILTTLLIICLFYFVIQVGMKWYLIVVLIYVSVGEYFMCLLATCKLFLEKCLKVEWFAVLLLGCNSSSYILVISLLPIGFANKYVLSFWRLLFYFPYCVPWRTKTKNVNEVQFIYFPFVTCAYGIISKKKKTKTKKPWPKPRTQKFTLRMLSCESLQL